MGNAGLPRKSPKSSLISSEDIPVAKRVKATPKKSSSAKLVILGLGVVGVSTVAFLGGALLNLGDSSSSEPAVSETPSSASTEDETSESLPAEDEPDPVESETENIFGHLPYAEAPLTELQAVTMDGRIKLRQAAAVKFLEMQGHARSQGIILTSLSGFRTISEQEHLFFEIKAQRRQIASTRAQVSAPPGYSEHHTGYAIDIGDGKTPATNLSESFEKTAAFIWLEKNAARYSFELSFPQDNVQGINYEPWHWRFVGDSHSLEMFHKAKELPALQN